MKGVFCKDAYVLEKLKLSFSIVTFYCLILVSIPEYKKNEFMSWCHLTVQRDDWVTVIIVF
jgi:hypothetical protein